MDKLYRRLIQKTCSKIYSDTDRDTRKSIMIAGSARSGTTWLAEIIASQLPCRIMFEPFHSRKVPAFRDFNYFQYMRPAEQNSALHSYCQRVFSGNIRNSWIDRQVDSVFPKFRLIKEIRANLFLKWMHNSFPDIPLLFIIRHPCSVVLSRIQLDWATDSDIDSFLNQKHLVDDFLSDKIDLIRSAKTIEEKHAIIWCISNIVPLKQFGLGQLNSIFYENLKRNKVGEITRVFQLLGHSYDDTVFALAGRPSMTTGSTSAIISGENEESQWKSKLSPAQIRSILSVVQKFQLDYIYGDSSEPLVTAL